MKRAILKGTSPKAYMFNELVGLAVLCPPFGIYGQRRARSDAPYRCCPRTPERQNGHCLMSMRTKPVEPSRVMNPLAQPLPG